MEESMRAGLVVQAGRVRHPALPLSHFLADTDDPPEDWDGEDVDRLGLPADAVERARFRRATLGLAAATAVQQCLDDLRTLEFGEEGPPTSGDAGTSFVMQRFPPRFRDRYDRRFFQDVLVTAVKVGYDLADPHAGPPACIAEEIIRDAVIEDALALCDEHELGEPWRHPTEDLLEDLDFRLLFQSDMDGVEDDAVYQVGRGMWVPGIEDWFTPFNADRVVHPFVETAPTDRPRVPDLRWRLGPEHEADLENLLADAVLDAPAPIVGVEPTSEVVDLARRAARRRSHAGLWVADESDPEGTFGDLVRVATRSGGGGWLVWEPHEGADTVRTDPVLVLRPHRHFPVGADTAWVDIAVGTGTLLAVPLAYVVSYRPDPGVARRWTTLPEPGGG